MNGRRCVLWLLVFAVVRVGEAMAEEAPSSAGDDARARFERSLRLHDARDYDGAIAELERLLSELPADHPMVAEIVRNIAVCYELLHEYDRAREHFRRYLELHPHADDRIDVERRLALLEQLVGAVELEANASPIRVFIDGREVSLESVDVLEQSDGHTRVRFDVPGGAHVFEVSSVGRSTERQEHTVAGGETLELSFRLRRTVVHRAVFWSLSSFAVAAVCSGAALGGVALARHGDLEAMARDDAQRWLVTDEDTSRVERLAMAADILYGTAALFAIASTVIAFFTEWHHHAEGARTSTGRASDPPRAWVGLEGMSIRGVF